MCLSGNGIRPRWDCARGCAGEADARARPRQGVRQAHHHPRVRCAPYSVVLTRVLGSTHTGTRSASPSPSPSSVRACATYGGHRPGRPRPSGHIGTGRPSLVGAAGTTPCFYGECERDACRINSTGLSAKVDWVRSRHGHRHHGTGNRNSGAGSRNNGTDNWQ
jgi:hypothetical protein